MKYLISLILCSILLTLPLPSSLAQSNPASQADALLQQAQNAVNQGNLTTARTLITAAQTLLTSSNLEEDCPILPQVKGLLDKALSAQTDIVMGANLSAARGLLGTCLTTTPVATPTTGTAQGSNEEFFFSQGTNQELIVETTGEKPVEELTAIFDDDDSSFTFAYPAAWITSFDASSPDFAMAANEGAAFLASLPDGIHAGQYLVGIFALNLDTTISENGLDFLASNFATLIDEDVVLSMPEDVTTEGVMVGYVASEDSTMQVFAVKLSEDTVGFAVGYSIPEESEGFKPLLLQMALSIKLKE